MRKEDLQNAFDDLKAKLLAVFREMASEAVNPKTGQPTLNETSNFYQNIKIEQEDMEMIEILVPYYVRYIDAIDEDGKQWEWARRPWAMVKSNRSLASWRPPLRAIIPWMRKRGLPTDNETVYKMSTAIAVNGILPRPIFNNWEAKTDEIMEKWFDELFNAIVASLDNYFSA